MVVGLGEVDRCTKRVGEKEELVRCPADHEDHDDDEESLLHVVGYLKMPPVVVVVVDDIDPSGCTVTLIQSDNVIISRSLL